MFGSTFSTGERAAPEESTLRHAQLIQERNMLNLSIRAMFHGRHSIGLCRTRAILHEHIQDYRQLSTALAL